MEDQEQGEKMASGGIKKTFLVIVLVLVSVAVLVVGAYLAGSLNLL